MLKYLELCQNSSLAQIMFWYQDLSNRNLSLNLDIWGSSVSPDTELCCIRGQSEADEPSTNHRWTLSTRWILSTGLGLSHSRTLRQKVECCKSCSPGLGRERKAFAIYFLYIQLPVLKPQHLHRTNLIICSFRNLRNESHQPDHSQREDFEGARDERRGGVSLPRPLPAV